MFKKTCASCLLASLVFSSLVAENKAPQLSEETIASANVIELTEGKDFSEIQFKNKKNSNKENNAPKKKLSKQSAPLIIINLGKENTTEPKAVEPKTQNIKAEEKVLPSNPQVDSTLGYFSVGLGSFPFPLPALLA